ncbi:ROK family protein [Sutcliffiella sp. NPDC057660]|uniref:ROK family protein n=1 Tax=Sutcliffiella sp. NPDC057660 TaxID=3346199 RepID=UPI003685B415
MGYTLAVDIGGTKIAAGIMDDKKEWVSDFTQKSDVATREAMYDCLLSTMYQAIGKAGLKKEQIDRFGVALPGILDIESGIAIYQNNLPWRNFPLRGMLQKEFPNGTFCLEHDVSAAALGEYAVRKHVSEIFIYVTVSTGIAATILHRGEPIRGDGSAGEIGFFPIGKGTLESNASGSAMERELNEVYKINSIDEGMKLWHSGNLEMEGFFSEKATRLALAIFQLTASLGPEKVVLGGGVINNQPEFFELIYKKFKLLCTHPIQNDWILKLEKSVLKEKSGLFGAATKARYLKRNAIMFGEIRPDSL